MKDVITRKHLTGVAHNRCKEGTGHATFLDQA